MNTSGDESVGFTPNEAAEAALDCIERAQLNIQGAVDGTSGLAMVLHNLDATGQGPHVYQLGMISGGLLATLATLQAMQEELKDLKGCVCFNDGSQKSDDKGQPS